MGVWTMVGCATTGFLVCWLLIPLLQRRTVLATQRHFHHEPEAGPSRFGGVAIVAGFGVVTLVAVTVHKFGPLSNAQTWGVLLGSLGMFGLGLWDDCKPLGAKVKLLGQM